MYCKKCGKEVIDGAAACPYCGTVLGGNDVMTGGLVALCILVPIAGLVYGLVQNSNGKTESGGKCIKYSLIVMGISFVLTVIGNIALLLL